MYLHTDVFIHLKEWFGFHKLWILLKLCKSEVTNGLCLHERFAPGHIWVALVGILGFWEWLQVDKEKEKGSDREIKTRPLGNREEDCESRCSPFSPCIRLEFITVPLITFYLLSPLNRCLSLLSSPYLCHSISFQVFLSPFLLNFLGLFGFQGHWYNSPGWVSCRVGTWAGIMFLVKCPRYILFIRRKSTKKNTLTIVDVVNYTMTFAELPAIKSCFPRKALS